MNEGVRTNTIPASLGMYDRNTAKRVLSENATYSIALLR